MTSSLEALEEIADDFLIESPDAIAIRWYAREVLPQARLEAAVIEAARRRHRWREELGMDDICSCGVRDCSELHALDALAPPPSGEEG